jgi:hypothetical protein
MLFAQFQPQNDVETVAFTMGAIFAGIVSGSIPFGYGISARQPGLGIAGGIISGLTGALLGCCGGFPVAFLFCGIIALVANISNAGRGGVREPRAADYDDYAHTEDDFRRALPRYAEPVDDDDRRDRGEDRRRDPGDDRRRDAGGDRPRWRQYDNGERRRDERPNRDW